MDASALELPLTVLTSWLARREREALAYLIEENRLLRRLLRGQRLELTDDDRRRLAVRAYRLGRQRLREIAKMVIPTPCCGGIVSSSPGNGRTRLGPVVVAYSPRSGTSSFGWRQNPTLGDTRIQGALKNVGQGERSFQQGQATICSGGTL